MARPQCATPLVFVNTYWVQVFGEKNKQKNFKESLGFMKEPPET
jgi:hypothetical protein